MLSLFSVNFTYLKITNIMLTKLSKTKEVKEDSNLVFLAEKSSDFPSGIFDKKELDYINKKIKSGNKPFVVNQYKRFVFIVPAIKEQDPIKQKESYRKAGTAICQIANENKLGELIIQSEDESVLDLAEGIALTNYQFLKHKSEKKENSLKKIKFSGSEIAKKDVEELENIVTATCLARDMVNEPVCSLNAEVFAQEMARAGKESGFKTEIFNKRKIQSLKMGGVLAVNQGSDDPPTFTVMEWKPSNAKNSKPYILVGKGVVFDTGGMNIKVGEGMTKMKADMGGGAAVAGAMYAIAKNKLPVHVVGLVPATDNRLNHNAYVPGDVVTMHSGKTVEVLNTDAEGRMIMADALSYAKKYKPELVIDLATLTGAAMRTLGFIGVAGMGTAGEERMKSLQKAGHEVYERVAELPFWEEYGDLIKSDVADIKNIGGPVAGSITAGKFLEHFTDYPWIHLDIAGPAILDKNDSYRTKGGSGVGVRLLYNFFKNIK